MKPTLYSAEGRFEAATWYGPFRNHPASCARALPKLGIAGSLVLEEDAGQGGAHLPELGLRVAPILDPHPGLFFVRPHLAKVLPRFLENRQNPAHRVRVPCWNHSEERTAYLDAIAARASGYKPENLLWISVANEGSSTKQNAAFDFCACTFCIEAFRRWLSRRYGSLPMLNQAWHTSHTTWETVLPVATDVLKEDLDTWFSAWFDTRQFTDEGYHDALSEACAKLRAIRPGLPLSLNGLWPPGPFGSQNWDRIGELFDLVECNNECGDIELARSLVEGKADIAFTFAIEKEPGHGASEHAFWMFFIHGARAVIIEKFRRLFNLDTDQALTSGANALAALLETARDTLAPALAGATREDDPVLVLHSPRSQARAWAEKALAGDEDWVCRPPEWQHNEEPYLAAQESWYRLIEDAGRQFKVVSHRTGLDSRPGTGRLLVVPLPAALSDAEKTWIQQFSGSGGAVVCCRELKGIKGPELKLDPAVENYRQTRLGSARPVPELAKFRAFADTVLPPPFARIESDRNERVEITVFRKDATRILALHRNDICRNFTASIEPDIPERVSLTIAFNEPVLVENLLAPNACAQPPNERVRVDLEWTTPVFLKVSQVCPGDT